MVDRARPDRRRARRRWSLAAADRVTPAEGAAMESLPVASRNEATLKSRGREMLLAVLVLVIGLPVAVWLDLEDISARALGNEAAQINEIISSIRSYYGTNVVGRVLNAPG